MIVVDASLAVKWLVIEASSDAAEQVLDANDIAAPDLIMIEVAGALVRRANETKALAAAMRAALVRWEGLLSDHLIDLFPPTPVALTRAGNLAIDLGHPVKDCLYLALAMDLDCPLVTADARFAAKARGVYADVRVLG